MDDWSEPQYWGFDTLKEWESSANGFNPKVH
jgi:hypothetical protein